MKIYGPLLILRTMLLLLKVSMKDAPEGGTAIAVVKLETFTLHRRYDAKDVTKILM